jgi:hypothetical protein
MFGDLRNLLPPEISSSSATHLIAIALIIKSSVILTAIKALTNFVGEQHGCNVSITLACHVPHTAVPNLGIQDAQ